MSEVRQAAAARRRLQWRATLGRQVGDLSLLTAQRLLRAPPVLDIPPGQMRDLPGRGSVYVTDTGPPESDDAPRNSPPIFLLHGVATSGLLNWYPVLDALRRRYRIVIMDQRWHAQGIRSPRFDLDDCADDVAAVADALGIDGFVCGGYSMGSLVSQLVWRRHRDRVAGLVLAASTTHFADTPRAQRAVVLMGTRVAGLIARERRLVVDALDPAVDNRWAWRQFRSTTAAEIATAAAVIARFDSRGWINDAQVPTSVVITARDRLMPAARQRDLARRIPDCAVYEIDAGHTACVRDVDQFRPAMLAACASVTNRIADRPAEPH